MLYETETQLPVRAGVRGSPTARARSSSTRARRSTRSTGPGSYLTGNYWDGFLVLPFAGSRRRRRARVAILGNAAGTMARAYGHYFPSTQIDAVEIDPELTEIGRRYFDLRGARS